MKVIGTFDYSVKSLMQIEMIGMIVIDVDTPNGASRIVTDGELNLIQAAPIRIDSVKRTLYNTNPLDDYQTYSMLEILEFYNNRKGKLTSEKQKVSFIEDTSLDIKFDYLCVLL